MNDIDVVRYYIIDIVLFGGYLEIYFIRFALKKSDE